MAITSTGLKFHPLFWVHHDCWQYFNPYVSNPTAKNHWGHLHFFMLGYDITASNADAFSGQQNFIFEIKDRWGPRSADPNQSDLYRVIGTPKWYYRVVEVWRRVFIQPWDTKVDASQNVLLGRGIRYDASPVGQPWEDNKTFGPFREGMANNGQTSYAPYWIKGARSLPIEYYKTGNLEQAARDNYVAERAQALLGDAYVDERYNLQHGNQVPEWNEEGQSGHPAGVQAFADGLYIFPVIEYQEVIQLDWEIMPGSTPDVTNLDHADAHYGDGWGTQLQVPFIDPQIHKYRSPFANNPGQVLPFGSYNEAAFVTNGSTRKLVPTANRLKYGEASYAESGPGSYRPGVDLPAAKSGQLVSEWHNPWGEAAGGKIVQQCLGGRVEARARVIIEHKLGGRQEVWVDSMQYLPQTDFEGSDQDQPAP